MIVEIIREHRKWKMGDTPDVTVSFGNELIAMGIARRHEDQTRRDALPKPEEKKEPEKIEVHNYFMTSDADKDSDPPYEWMTEKRPSAETVKPKRKQKK